MTKFKPDSLSGRMETVRLNVELKPEQLDQIRQCAKEHNLTIAAFVRQALAFAIENLEKS